nr:MAG TPA: hypothetical protein [Caudoviricetes sp.]
MTIFPLMYALKKSLVSELSDFLLPDTDRSGAVSYPSLPPAVYIGSLPSKTDENQVPFVLVQDLGGSLLANNVQTTKVAFRCAVQAENIEDACEDLHNLMSRVASYCAGTQTVPLEGRYRLGFWEGDRLIDWGRPDGQAQPYQEGVILTRWELPAGI